MTYEIPKSKAATKEGQFAFRLGGSRKQYSIPLLQYLPVDRSLAASRFEAGDFKPDDLRDVLATLFGSEEVGELILSLDGEQVSGLMGAWREASDIGMGESPASED